MCNGVANAIANSSFAEFKEFQATNTGSTIQLAGTTAVVTNVVFSDQETRHSPATTAFRNCSWD